jgi:signal transduction histidine kinase
MLIILTALVLMQVGYLVLSIAMSLGLDMQDLKPTESAVQVEKEWHEAAGSLAEVSPEVIRDLFAAWKSRYPEASMFWVDGDGVLREQTAGREGEIPTQWTAVSTAQFIKSRYGGDPFTVIAFVGQEGSGGFVVIEMPRAMFDPPIMQVYDRFGTWVAIGMIVIVVVFILISYLFFRRIRKRLTQLQEAMTLRDVDGLPVQVELSGKDEIGQLEQSFNEMVLKLKVSKQREEQEEQLRRELIANLSHDLRTPLTKIRAQAYTIGKEEVSSDGRRAIEALERSVVNLDRLIDNLMSYTLLMAGRYQYNPQTTDIVRLVKEHLATWYPLFEKEGIEVDADLQPLRQYEWRVDPLWMGRVLDNLYQNVLRHARSGRYIQVTLTSAEQYDAIIVSDHGPGMQSGQSEERGAGIGLSIVDRMLRGMDLDWDIQSDERGTTIIIKRYRK